MNLDLPTPRWGLPFLEPKRYKGLKGGRASGKSHFFGEMVVEALILNPHLNIVCLREVQRSLKFSAKKLIEDKIRTFGAGGLFLVLDTEIRRRGDTGATTGRIIFQGMQDHTADSIKSLEGFNIAWFEEASRMSRRSLELLRPTIREEGSEIWFSWNPDQETDPVEQFLLDPNRENAIVHHVNYTENIFCPEVMREEAEDWRRNDPDTFGHVWLGEHNTKSDDQVLHGKWVVEEFRSKKSWAGPYYGADWGFSTDPNALVECWVDEETNELFIRAEVWELHVEIDDTEDFFDKMSGMKGFVIRADNARPELISHMKRHSYPKIIAAEKWPGSIEDGISKLRSFRRIVIHSDCTKTAEEARLYKYKRDRLTDDILPEVIDKHNHCIDAIRYAIEPLTKRKSQSFWD